MKNKRLLVILLVFVILGGAAVSSALVFRVQKIEVVFMNETEYIADKNLALSSYTASAKKVAKGKNILIGLDRTKLKNEIEKDPQIRVNLNDIEAKFPNKLEIRVRERYPIYMFTHTPSGRTAIMDAELRIVTDERDLAKFTARPEGFELINISGDKNRLAAFDVTPDFVSFRVGDNISNYIDDSHIKRAEHLILMAQLFNAQDYKEDALCHLLQDIDFDADKTTPPTAPTNTMVILLRVHDSQQYQNNIRLEIRNFETRFNEKLKEAWDCLQKKSGYQLGWIVSDEDLDGKIVASWNPGAWLK